MSNPTNIGSRVFEYTDGQRFVFYRTDTDRGYQWETYYAVAVNSNGEALSDPIIMDKPADTYRFQFDDNTYTVTSAIPPLSYNSNKYNIESFLSSPDNVPTYEAPQEPQEETPQETEEAQTLTDSTNVGNRVWQFGNNQTFVFYRTKQGVGLISARYFAQKVDSAGQSVGDPIRMTKSTGDGIPYTFTSDGQSYAITSKTDQYYNIESYLVSSAPATQEATQDNNAEEQEEIRSIEIKSDNHVVFNYGTGLNDYITFVKSNGQWGIGANSPPITTNDEQEFMAYLNTNPSEISLSGFDSHTGGPDVYIKTINNEYYRVSSEDGTAELVSGIPNGGTEISAAEWSEGVGNGLYENTPDREWMTARPDLFDTQTNVQGLLNDAGVSDDSTRNQIEQQINEYLEANPDTSEDKLNQIVVEYADYDSSFTSYLDENNVTDQEARDTATQQYIDALGQKVSSGEWDDITANEATPEIHELFMDQFIPTQETQDTTDETQETQDTTAGETQDTTEETQDTTQDTSAGETETAENTATRRLQQTNTELKDDYDISNFDSSQSLNLRQFELDLALNIANEKLVTGGFQGELDDLVTYTAINQAIFAQSNVETNQTPVVVGNEINNDLMNTGSNTINYLVTEQHVNHPKTVLTRGSEFGAILKAVLFTVLEDPVVEELNTTQLKNQIGSDLVMQSFFGNKPIDNERQLAFLLFLSAYVLVVLASKSGDSLTPQELLRFLNVFGNKLKSNFPLEKILNIVNFQAFGEVVSIPTAGQIESILKQINSLQNSGNTGAPIKSYLDLIPGKSTFEQTYYETSVILKKGNVARWMASLNQLSDKALVEYETIFNYMNETEPFGWVTELFGVPSGSGDNNNEVAKSTNLTNAFASSELPGNYEEYLQYAIQAYNSNDIVTLVNNGSTLIVKLRGTKNLKDGLTDVTSVASSFDDRGVFDDIRPMLLIGLIQTVKIAGHSLGAVTGQHVILKILQEFPQIEVQALLFNSPAAWDSKEEADAFTSLVGDNDVVILNRMNDLVSTSVTNYHPEDLTYTLLRNGSISPGSEYKDTGLVAAGYEAIRNVFGAASTNDLNHSMLNRTQIEGMAADDTLINQIGMIGATSFGDILTKMGLNIAVGAAIREAGNRFGMVGTAGVSAIATAVDTLSEGGGFVKALVSVSMLGIRLAAMNYGPRKIRQYLNKAQLGVWDSLSGPVRQSFFKRRNEMFFDNSNKRVRISSDVEQGITPNVILRSEFNPDGTNPFDRVRVDLEEPRTAQLTSFDDGLEQESFVDVAQRLFGDLFPKPKSKYSSPNKFSRFNDEL